MFEGSMEFEAMSLYGGIPHGGLVQSTKFGALLSVQENLWGPSGRNRVSSIFRQSLTVGKFGEHSKQKKIYLGCVLSRFKTSRG